MLQALQPAALPRAVKLGREGLVAQQPAQSWDSVSSAGIPVLKCSGNDACSELWMIVEYCDRGTLGVRLASLGCAAYGGAAAWVQSPGAGRSDLSRHYFVRARFCSGFPIAEHLGGSWMCTAALPTSLS